MQPFAVNSTSRYAPGQATRYAPGTVKLTRHAPGQATRHCMHLLKLLYSCAFRTNSSILKFSTEYSIYCILGGTTCIPPHAPYCTGTLYSKRETGGWNPSPANSSSEDRFNSRLYKRSPAGADGPLLRAGVDEVSIYT